MQMPPAGGALTRGPPGASIGESAPAGTPDRRGDAAGAGFAPADERAAGRAVAGAEPSGSGSDAPAAGAAADMGRDDGADIDGEDEMGCSRAACAGGAARLASSRTGPPGAVGPEGPATSLSVRTPAIAAARTHAG